MGHQNVAIIGAGAWGTTLSCMIARKDCAVKIWAYKASTCEDINRFRENREFLPGIAITGNVSATDNIVEALKDARYVIIASPSHVLRQLFKKMAPHISSETDIISVTKGIEEKSFASVSQVAIEEFGGAELMNSRVAVISGPNLAREIAAGLPSTTVVASHSKKLCEGVQRLLASERFRVYTSSDVLGLEYGGSLKNIMAIGAGLCDGLCYGDNTKAAFLTRALREMVMIGELKGAMRETFYGLSGIGDLFATSFSKFSRNRTFGEKIARGMNKEQAESSISGIAEGVHTTRAAYLFGRKEKIDIPVINEIYSILYEGKSPAESVMSLMTRTLKGEI